MDMMTLPAMLDAICDEIEAKVLLLPKSNKLRFVLKKDEIDVLKRHFLFDFEKEFSEDEASNLFEKALLSDCYVLNDTTFFLQFSSLHATPRSRRIKISNGLGKQKSKFFKARKRTHLYGCVLFLTMIMSGKPKNKLFILQPMAPRLWG